MGWGIVFNTGIKSLTGDCVWDVNRDACRSYLSVSLTGCPATGIDQNECVAWTVSAGHTTFADEVASSSRKNLRVSQVVEVVV